jgi:HPt (histidine-containing phosphotransfer) domain-containing protein
MHASVYAVAVIPSPDDLPAATDASRQLLASLWKRGLPRLQERLAELDHAAAAAATGSLKSEARVQAAATAHKLAGSLGMFGYNEGTTLARQIEVALERDGEAEASALATLTVALRLSLGQ